MTTISLADPCTCGNLLMLVTDGIRFTLDCDRFGKVEVIDRQRARILILQSS